MTKDQDQPPPGPAADMGRGHVRARRGPASSMTSRAVHRPDPVRDGWPSAASPRMRPSVRGWTSEQLQVIAQDEADGLDLAHALRLARGEAENSPGRDGRGHASGQGQGDADLQRRATGGDGGTMSQRGRGSPPGRHRDPATGSAPGSPPPPRAPARSLTPDQEAEISRRAVELSQAGIVRTAEEQVQYRAIPSRTISMAPVRLWTDHDPRACGLPSPPGPRTSGPAPATRTGTRRRSTTGEVPAQVMILYHGTRPGTESGPWAWPRACPGTPGSAPSRERSRRCG